MKNEQAGLLRAAEQLLRAGRREKAVDAYARYLEAQPLDWAAANKLGDLLAELGKADAAVARFAAAAAVLDRAGFLEKSAAIYRKILKVRPEHETALLGLALASRPRPAGPGLRPAAPSRMASPDAVPARVQTAAVPVPTPAPAGRAPAENKAFATSAPQPPAPVSGAESASGGTKEGPVHAGAALALPGVMEGEAPETLEDVFGALRETFALRARSDDRDWAVAWFRRAAEALTDAADPYASLLYDLGDGLESLKDYALARTVFERLERHVPGYRDASARIERLSREMGEA